MIIVMINWLKLFAASEKTSSKFFNLKSDPVFSVALDFTAKLSLGKGAKLSFEIVGDPLNSFTFW